MITEIAQIDVKPGTEAEFENGVKNAVPIFKRAKGRRGMELQRSIEKPSRYRLFIGWDTVENHNIDFRGSADFQEWRKLVGHCFTAPPDVGFDAAVPPIPAHGVRYWQCAPARRIRGGTLRRARQSQRGSSHGTDWRSRAACGSCRNFDRSTIQRRD